MAFLSSSISINCDMSGHSIELLNDKNFLDRFNFSNLELKDFLRGVYNAICEGVVRFGEIE